MDGCTVSIHIHQVDARMEVSTVCMQCNANQKEPNRLISSHLCHKPKINHSSLPLLLNPNFNPIFFHGFSDLPLGLLASSPPDGVIGGVTGSATETLGLECRLPESSVKAPVTEPEGVSPLAEEEGGPELRGFARVVIAVRGRGKFERVDVDVDDEGDCG